ncbi:MAG TPA: signal peptidase I [Bacteroidia bacterium]|nr:signal peptidase I [Bacteroidia bacterium]
MPILKRYSLKTFLVSVLTGVLVFLACKFYLIDMAQVNSLSMSPMMGQNKWVFIRPYTFLSSAVKQGDVVQLAMPVNDKDTIQQPDLFFKRVVAIPHDTVIVNKSLLFVNGKILSLNDNLLHNYIIKFKQQKDTALFNEAAITEKYLVDDSCVYIVTLTRAKFFELKGRNISIKENSEDSGLYDENIFPQHPQIKWNKDFFGPLCIPQKNDTLRLDTANIALYTKLISVYENNELQTKGDTILINKKPVTYYVAKQNYYFVIGDNFDNSIDSRYWGFIPERVIKAKLIK